MLTNVEQIATAAHRDL